jgi:hypothetical protein
MLHVVGVCILSIHEGELRTSLSNPLEDENIPLRYLKQTNCLTKDLGWTIQTRGDRDVEPLREPMKRMNAASTRLGRTDAPLAAAIT